MLESNTRLETIHESLLGTAAGLPRRYPITLEFVGDRLLISGELPTIADKKRLLARAACIGDVGGLIDRLRVLPEQTMADFSIRDELLRLLKREPAFFNHVLGERIGTRTEPASHPCRAPGRIEYAVQDGVVFLDGAVPGLGHKRLAGVLAWWVPGTRDVVNRLLVCPPEEDSGDLIADAVRLVLEKDSRLDSAWICVVYRRGAVVLLGHVSTEAEMTRAERDAWCVLGVDTVVNRLKVRV